MASIPSLPGMPEEESGARQAAWSRDCLPSCQAKSSRWGRKGCTQELTQQGDDESNDMKQPVQDLGRAFGFFSEDTVHQESLWKWIKL